MKSFNVMALDANFQIISLIRYTSIQWNRKWHEPGNFSVEIPLGQYTNTIKYIYTKDRPEMGKVTQINFINRSGYKSIHLSGYFLENELNRRIAYQCPSTIQYSVGTDVNLSNITNFPTWTKQTGNAENVAVAFFDGFKNVNFADMVSGSYSIQCKLGIERPNNSKSRGNTAEHTRNGERLGDKIYDILKPSGLSYRVVYDFYDNQKVFDVVNGLDRTDTQSTNNQVVFSTKYGNIKNPNILIDDSDAKNACIIHDTGDYYSSIQPESSESNMSDEKTSIGAYSNKLSGATGSIVSYDDSFLYVESAADKEDYNSLFDNIHKSLLNNQCKNDLVDYVQILNVEFDAMEGSYEYGEDFDIGDVVNIEIYEIGLSETARLIGCNEVVKSGKWTLTLEFGTPLIKNK